MEKAERADIEARLGYRFRDERLLETCFTHASYAGLYGTESNERLEFLGDALLGFLVAERLYGEGGASEGEMTSRRIRLVSARPLEAAVRAAGLERYLRTADGITGKKAISSLFEALVAGIYLDGGMDCARAFAEKHLSPGRGAERNYKGELQEFLQGVHLPLAEYSVVARTGAAHAPHFTVRASGGGMSAEGEGESVREAEKRAAKRLLCALRAKGEEHIEF